MYILSDTKLSRAAHLAQRMQGILKKPVRQLVEMPKVVEFTNVHYIRLRTKVHKFLADHPNIVILDIIETRTPPKAYTPISKTIRIIYEEE